MRIHKLWLEGYGRFSNRELELHPGLQLILGPNEQGKSTTRSFVGDMLYGQKQSGSQRTFEDNHELRRPWHEPERYRGRIAYELDNGRKFEVHRSFAEDDAWVQVLEGEGRHDVTSDFERLQNGEINFAERHLGLSKEVFLHAATLSHLTLEGLGDADAMDQIRERILALADSGDEAGSAKQAIERLQARIARIGRNDLPKRPLPAARNRLHDLQHEYEEAIQHTARVKALEARRRATLNEEAQLRAQRSALEEDLQRLGRRDDARRLHEVNALAAQVDALTQRCFELGSARNFPLEALQDVQRLELQLSSTRAQHRRTLESLDAVRARLDEEAPEPAAGGTVAEVPDALEDRLLDLDAHLKSLRERRNQIEHDRSAAQERLDELQKALAAMPDFSRVASDPVEWFTQLGTSFTLARRSFDEESTKLQATEGQRTEARAALRPLAPLFEAVSDFPAEVQAYRVRVNQLHELELDAARLAEEHRFHAEEYQSSAPTNRLMAFLAAVFMIVLAAAPWYTGNKGTYIPAALCAVPLVYFVSNLASGGRAAARARRAAESAARDVERIREEDASSNTAIARLLEQAGCQTVRELEALYDDYTEALHRNAEAESTHRRQQEALDDARRRLDGLFEKLVAAFQQVGSKPSAYDDIPDAVGRAIGRYQEYRDTKRRIADARDHVNHFDQQFRRLGEEVDAARAEEAELSREIRRIMRGAGYDEAKHDNTLGAIRAFKVIAAESRERSVKVTMLRQQLDQLKQDSQREDDDLATIQREVSALLDAAGVDSLDMWHEMAALARDYREARGQLTALQERMNGLLQGTSREALQQAATGHAADIKYPARSAGDVRTDITAATEAIERLQTEAHDLHVAVAEQSALHRPLCVIEEERSALMRQIQMLELEVQAASYAIALIQEAAQDKHARIAPRLAELASTYLAEITGGRYTELAIDRDFNMHVRIPQRDTLDSEVERRLSKGTVDQIYLALRLAMIRMLSRNGESIPMILDDPFANYDDERLARTMALLVGIAQHNQILLFTCREDVATVARSLAMPVIAL